MRSFRRTLLGCMTASSLAFTLGLSVAQPSRAAEAYPARVITLVVPYPAGGTIDHLARDFAEHLRSRFGKGVVVENRGGGNGIIGSEYVRRAAPDGYTLLVGGGSTHSLGPATDPEMRYDPIRDFTALAYFGDTPLVLAAGPTLADTDFKGMIERARRKKDSVSYASVGTSTLLAANLIGKAAGVSLMQVNYKQFGPALLDVTRGDVDMAISSLSISLSNIQQKMLRPLAVTSRQRSPLLPDVPAISETYPGTEVLIWFGLFGPAALPEAIRSTLAQEATAFTKNAAREARWEKDGLSLRAQSGQEFSAFVQADYLKWKTLALEAGLRKDK